MWLFFWIPLLFELLMIWLLCLAHQDVLTNTLKVFHVINSPPRFFVFCFMRFSFEIFMRFYHIVREVSSWLVKPCAFLDQTLPLDYSCIYQSISIYYPHNSILRIPIQGLIMLIYDFNSCTWESETGRSLGIWCWPNLT